MRSGAAVLLLVPALAGCVVAGPDDAAWVTLDEDARAQGYALEIDGKTVDAADLGEAYPIFPEQSAVLITPIGREPLDVHPGDTLRLPDRRATPITSEPSKGRGWVMFGAFTLGSNYGLTIDRWKVPRDMLSEGAIPIEDGEQVTLTWPCGSTPLAVAPGEAVDIRSADQQFRTPVSDAKQLREAVAASEFGVWSPKDRMECYANGADTGIAKDLALELAWSGPGSVDRDESWRVAAKIVNHSRSESYRIVRPGDGSEMGWREPRVEYVADYEAAPGVWREVPMRTDISRCGNYDDDWPHDVVTIAPGASLPIEWMPGPAWMLDFPANARVRLRAHLVYAAGATLERSPLAGGAKRVLPPDAAVIPAFELYSEPLAIEVHSPDALTLDVEAIGSLERAAPAHLADVLAIELRNRSDADVTVDGRFDLEVKSDGYWDSVPELKPSAVVVAAHGFVGVESTRRDDGREDAISRRRSGPAKVRLRYGYDDHGRDGATVRRTLRSRWVELTVRD